MCVVHAEYFSIKKSSKSRIHLRQAKEKSHCFANLYCFSCSSLKEEEGRNFLSFSCDWCSVAKTLSVAKKTSFSLSLIFQRSTVLVAIFMPSLEGNLSFSLVFGHFKSLKSLERLLVTLLVRYLHWTELIFFKSYIDQFYWLMQTEKIHRKRRHIFQVVSQVNCSLRFVTDQLSPNDSS